MYYYHYDILIKYKINKDLLKICLFVDSITYEWIIYELSEVLSNIGNHVNHFEFQSLMLFIPERI